MRSLVCNPFNSQFLISYLTNSNGCGNLWSKVLLTVSPFRPFLPPQPRVFSQPFNFCQPCPPRRAFVFITIQIPLRACPPKWPLSFIYLQTPWRATPFFSHPYKTPGVSPLPQLTHSSQRSRLSPTLLFTITSLQALYFHAIPHSFAQRRSAIPSILKSFRTLSIATGVVPLFSSLQGVLS
jgi:hypothetical protein